MSKLFKKPQGSRMGDWDREAMFGPDMNFAVSEAYKLLRTNVMFSFAAEERCHVVGITSALRGEGKSSTACNLSYALAEAGKKTLLLEADLRLPSISAKLGLQSSPGLTNLLVSRMETASVIQPCTAIKGMDVITAGQVPPNPSELLGSQKMEALIEELSRHYDFIVVDLPPITAVTDALVMSRLLHGVIMVVLNEAVERSTLAEAIRQLKLVDVRLLGFVYHGFDSPGGSRYSRYGRKYGKYYKYHRYYQYEKPGGEGRK